MLLQQKDVLWDLRPESRLHNTDSRHCARSWQKEGEDEGLREEVLEHWCGGARSPEGPERVGGGIHSRHRAFCLGTTVPRCLKYGRKRLIP